MKKGIYVYPESNNRRHCVRIAKRLTGTPSDPKKRFPWSDYLSAGVSNKTASKEDWRTARRCAKDAADAFAAERAAVIGTPRQVAFSLTPNQATDAIQALALLNGKATLVEVVKDYLLRHHPHTKATITQLVEKCIEAKKHNAKATRASVEPMLRRFAIHVGSELLVSEVSTGQIDEFIKPRAGFGNNSRRTYLRELRTLFRWALKRKYVGHNIAEDVDMPPKDRREIGTLSVQQTFQLLKIAQKEFDGELLAAIVLAIFCGIRRHELLRLDWSAVNLVDRILTVSAAAAKTSQRRNIKIRDASVEWLMLSKNKTGPICPTNFQAKFTALVIRAGFADAKGLPNFPRNTLRHGFASYLAPIEGLAVTVDELGHSSLKMVRDHYRDLKLEREARAFWKLTPSLNDLQLAAMLAPTPQMQAVSA